MITIKTRVNPRLLKKASRLFAGTLQGRIIEILQNARRTGASEVSIINRDGKVHVEDNSEGIEHVAQLLDLGGSDWGDATTVSEDHAGVGIFCLAPRQVTIRSKGKKVTIAENGWSGAAVAVEEDRHSRRGTSLEFEDSPWTMDEVQPNAVFAGMEVIVDGEPCGQIRFVSDQAGHHPELGCRIEARPDHRLYKWHDGWSRGSGWGNVLVNFHGRVVAFRYQPVEEHSLFYLVNMTGEPTGIRLMLPAGTQLVENEAFEQLKQAIEREAYRYFQRKDEHRLAYARYLRARELGIKLPEAKPSYIVGLLWDNFPEPVQVHKPEGFPLSKCYRFDPDQRGRDMDEANAHILGAMGTFDNAFVPVCIPGSHDGYSWSKLPTIQKVSVMVGKVLRESCLGSRKLLCVDSLRITAETSDGKTWSSPVCMAMGTEQTDKAKGQRDDTIYITPAARESLEPCNLWYHVGDFCEDGDPYETLFCSSRKEVDAFWGRLVGPDEGTRRRVLEAMEGFHNWEQAALSTDDTLTVHFKDGSTRVIEPANPRRP